MGDKRKWKDFTGMIWTQGRHGNFRSKVPMILVIVFLILANGSASLDMQTMRLCTDIPGGTVSCIGTSTAVLGEMLKLGLITIERGVSGQYNSVSVLWFRNIAVISDILAGIAVLIARRQKKFAKDRESDNEKV